MDEAWQDLLKDKEFFSDSDRITMDEVATTVEKYIEDLYVQRHGEKWGKLQVQAYKLSDLRGTDHYTFQEEVTTRLQPGDTVAMAVKAIYAIQPPHPQMSQEMFDNVRKMLRFGVGDRVLCNIGPRHVSGVIVDTAVPSHSNELVLPYLVETDPFPGYASRRICVPQDSEVVCVQETCFDAETELDLIRSATQVIEDTSRVKLRFGLGDKVICRVENDAEDWLEVWVPGFVKGVWPSIGEASWSLGKLANVVHYKVELATGKWIYCHRDDHTLIRRQGMQPKSRVAGISKRYENIVEPRGRKFRLDYETGRRKRLCPEELSDSE